LAIFDLLIKPEPKLTKDEETQVKKVARDLLRKLKEHELVFQWRQRQQTRAAVRAAIRIELNELPEEPYPQELWDEKVEMTWQFVFNHYPGPSGVCAQSTARPSFISARRVGPGQGGGWFIDQCPGRPGPAADQPRTIPTPSAPGWPRSPMRLRRPAVRRVSEMRVTVALGLMVAIAAPPADAVQVIGVGLGSCGTWTADRAARDVDEVADRAWVVGYLSGAAVWGPDLNPLQGVDAQAVWAWLDNYCRAHPLVKIQEAANAFIDEHPGR